MEAARIAPMVLRLGRHRLRQTKYRQLFSRGHIQLARSLTTTAPRYAAPLPPSPEATGVQTSPVTEALNDPEPPPPRRSLRPWIWATTFFLMGVFGSGVMRAIAFPPPLPEPGSEEDEYNLSRYRSDLNGLPIIAELRKDRDTWREYDPYSQREALGTGQANEEDAVEHHMTAGTLRGARGLAVQRAFYNATEHREITVMFFGGAVSGWPGVTHGGVLATVLKEAVERAVNGPAFVSRDAAAIGAEGTKQAPTGGFGSPRKRYDCDSLTLNYKKPTNANAFYVIRAEAAGDLSTPGSVNVKASIENALTGQITVLATATCSPSTASGKAAQATQATAGGIWGGITGIFGGGSNENART